MPGFFGFGSGFGLPGLGAAGAGARGARGELFGEWHGDGAPKVAFGDGAPKVVHDGNGAPKVVVSDTKYGMSSRELEDVDSVVAAKLADALSPSTGWRPPVAAPVEFFQK